MTRFTRGGRAFHVGILGRIRRSWAAPVTKRRRQSVLAPHCEPLELRLLMSAASWQGGSGNWDDASHWSTGVVPGVGGAVGATVTISTTSAATITILPSDGINVASVTTGAKDTLSITGGLLEVTAGGSTLNGPLDMSGGSLEATGKSVSLTANAATTVSQANLYAESGGTLKFPKLTSSVSNGTFEASGTGSVLDVSALTTLTQIGGWTVHAYNGGTVKLSGLTSLVSTHGISIDDRFGSTLLDSKLTSLNGVSVRLDGTDQQVVGSWTKLINGSLEVDGNASGSGYSLFGLTDVDGSNLYAESGGQLTLPKLTSYVSNGTFEANGTNTATSAPSLLNVSALTTLTQTGGWAVHAYNGGKVNLSGFTSLAGTHGISIDDRGGGTLLDGKLTSLNGVSVRLDGTDQQVAGSWTKFINGSLEVDGNTSGSGYSLPGLTDVDGSNLYAESGGQLTLPKLTSYVSNGTFEANGTNTATTAPSLLNVSALTTLTQSGGWAVHAYSGGKVNLSGFTSLVGTHGISIDDRGGGTLLDRKLTSLNGVSVRLDGTDQQVAGSWTKFINGSLEVDGNTSGSGYSLPGLTDVDGSNLYAESGGQLTLPKLTKYVSNGTFEANGTNSATSAPSLLNLAALTTLTQTGGWSVHAYNGGTVKLLGLTSLTSTHGITIDDSGDSTILDGKLTTLNGVSARLDGTDPNVANAWTKFINGTLEVDGNLSDLGYSLSGLTDVDGSNLYAESGGRLALPHLTSYASNGTFEANGTNSATTTPSVLDVSALTKLTQTGGWSVHAYSGGTLKLSGLTSLIGTKGITIDDTGSSMLLDAKLTTLSGVSVKMDGTDPTVAMSWKNFTNGNLEVDTGSYTFPALTNVNGSSLYAELGAQMALPHLATYTPNGTFEANGMNTATAVTSVLNLSALTTINAGSLTINALNGGEVVLSSLTSLPAGVTIHDTGGSTILNGKLATLTGDNVTTDGSDPQLPKAWTTFTGGTLTLTAGSLNFPKLTDADLAISVGETLTLPVLTKGSVSLVNGSSVSIQSTAVSLPADGTSGAKISIPKSQGLTIDLQNSGTLTGTTINVGQGSKAVLAGGSYLGGVTFSVGTSATVDLTGATRPTYGGTLSGSGTGTVLFASNGITTDVAGLTLNFPAGMFQWTGGEFFGAVTNKGTLSLPDGHNLDVSGNFTNNGSLTVGAGTVLAVGGNFTQGSSGTLNVQIGGSPASGKFSLISVSGSASLAGTLHVSLVNSFTPVNGQDFVILEYKSVTGSFATVSGLPSGMTVNKTATELSLDMPAAATAAKPQATAAKDAAFANW